MMEDQFNNEEEIEVLPPMKLKEYLDEHIISQEEAKRVVSTAVYKHFMRILQPDFGDGVDINKGNLLLIGASGSGKTEIARQLAKKFGLPFTIFDISNVSASGYVGNDLVFCLKDLLDAAHGNVRLAECGIIFIDEFNKIARKSGANNSITQDVGGEKVQGELLRMIEDGICDVPTERGRLNPQQPMIKMNCKNILFIFSGAFEGLDRIVEKRVLGNTVGFDTKHKSTNIDENDILKYVTPDDLMQYGIMKELVSRITTITHVQKLTKKELVKILTEPKNALIKQVKKLFKMQEKEIKFTKDAIELIAEKAEESNTGARALRGIVDKITDDYLYRISEIEEPIIKIGKKEVIKALEVA